MHEVLNAIVLSLPGLGMVLIIIIISRMAARALDVFFCNVQDGTIKVQWMEPETARATRRIAGILLWLFALTVAYPYVPGSSSEAIKGVSVFAGLLLTLGASGMVNQVMSGLMVVYSRTMRTGDLIRVDDVTGEVMELGFLATKVRTSVGNEVSIPNARIVTAVVQNFSTFDAAIGPRISTTVTIGYDTPWRQVQAMLILASQKTEGVSAATPPEVVQRSLSDFYVEYELRCRIENAKQRVLVLSRLHAQIQDTFNEHGVQIMSPHFVAQPQDAVVIPPDKWSPAPAVQIGNG
jgi:small-conductance mechanosensitive channel